MTHIQTQNELKDKSNKVLLNVLGNVKYVLDIYKNLSYMIPQWEKTDIDSVDSVDSLGIGLWMMTRKIDDKYYEIPNYRDNINNPFHRAIWHIYSSLDHEKLTALNNYDNTHIYQIFIDVLNIFYLMSTTKSLSSYHDDNKKRFATIHMNNDSKCQYQYDEKQFEKIYYSNCNKLPPLIKFFRISSPVNVNIFNELSLLYKNSYSQKNISYQSVILKNQDVSFDILIKPNKFPKSNHNYSHYNHNNHYNKYNNYYNNRSKYRSSIMSNSNWRSKTKSKTKTKKCNSKS